jgi:hypothetical protein
MTESERGRVASIIAVIGERCEGIAVREGDLGLLAEEVGGRQICEGKSLDCWSKDVTGNFWVDIQCGCLVLRALYVCKSGSTIDEKNNQET